MKKVATFRVKEIMQHLNAMIIAKRNDDYEEFQRQAEIIRKAYDLDNDDIYNLFVKVGATKNENV